MSNWDNSEPVLRSADDARVWRATHMTVDEWRTVGLFAGLVLGVSLVSPRIAYIAVGAIALSVIVVNGNKIFTVLGGKQQ